MMVLKGIGVGSAAKMIGSVYFFIGLIIGLIVSLVAIVTGGIAAASSAGHGPPAWLGVILGAGAVLILPFVYALMGAIMAAIFAGLYNLLARLVGGIQLHLE